MRLGSVPFTLATRPLAFNNGIEITAVMNWTAVTFAQILLGLCQYKLTVSKTECAIPVTWLSSHSHSSDENIWAHQWFLHQGHWPVWPPLHSCQLDECRSSKLMYMYNCTISLALRKVVFSVWCDTARYDTCSNVTNYGILNICLVNMHYFVWHWKPFLIFEQWLFELGTFYVPSDILQQKIFVVFFSHCLFCFTWALLLNSTFSTLFGAVMHWSVSWLIVLLAASLTDYSIFNSCFQCHVHVSYTLSSRDVRASKDHKRCCSVQR